MVEENDLQKALKCLRENAAPLASAKAKRIYLEQFRKSKKAILFQEAPQGSIADRESYAYAHDEYVYLLQGLQEAVEQEETLKWKMTAAQCYIEVWRTEQANNRRTDGSHQ